MVCVATWWIVIGGCEHVTFRRRPWPVNIVWDGNRCLIKIFSERRVKGTTSCINIIGTNGTDPSCSTNEVEVSTIRYFETTHCIRIKEDPAARQINGRTARDFHTVTTCSTDAAI